MRWSLTASFINEQSDEKERQWLTPYVPGDRHKFDVIPRKQPLGSWHKKNSKVTGLKDWQLYWEQATTAVNTTEGGIITLFPQLPALVGLQQRLSGKRVPTVAWQFSVGSCYSGLKRSISQFSMKDINRFVVPTRRELRLLTEWLDVPKERFKFVPYQVPEIPVIYEEEQEKPFIAAIGSAFRDYPTLFEVVEKLNIPTILGSSARALEGLTLPKNVEAPLNIGRSDCLRLAQQARLNIIPLLIKPEVAAAGVVTVVEAMRMGRVIIATHEYGMDDYITHGETGFLVKPGSVKDLLETVEMLWNDEELRNRIGENAKRYAQENFSDEAAGRSLATILDEVADEFGMY
jgi:Glycosyl transferases group 1